MYISLQFLEVGMMVRCMTAHRGGVPQSSVYHWAASPWGEDQWTCAVGVPASLYRLMYDLCAYIVVEFGVLRIASLH